MLSIAIDRPAKDATGFTDQLINECTVINIDYIGNLIENSKNMLSMKYTSYNNPFDSNYHPEQDTSSLCLPQEQAYYCSLIGSANWCVTLGRYDIAYATSTLAQYSIAPRTGHL